MGFNQNSSFGFGSDGDQTGGTVTTANNGLSLVGTTTVVLGQDLNAPGDPAALTSRREIPMGDFSILLRGTGAEITFGTGPVAVGIVAMQIDATGGDIGLYGIRVDATSTGNTTDTVGIHIETSNDDVGTIYGIRSTVENTNAGISANLIGFQTSIINDTTGMSFGVIVETSNSAGQATGISVGCTNTASTATGISVQVTAEGLGTGILSLAIAPSVTSDVLGISCEANNANGAGASGSVIGLAAQGTGGVDGTIHGIRTTADNQGSGPAVALDIIATADSGNSTGLVVTSTSNSGTAYAARFSSGRVGINTDTPTARLHIAAGAAGANTAPLKFTAGTNNATAETGAMEYNGTNLFFVRTGTTRETIVIASAVTTEALVTDRTLTINFNGTTYKLLAVAV